MLAAPRLPEVEPLAALRARLDRRNAEQDTRLQALLSRPAARPLPAPPVVELPPMPEACSVAYEPMPLWEFLTTIDIADRIPRGKVRASAQKPAPASAIEAPARPAWLKEAPLKQPQHRRFRRDLPILGTKQRHLAGREIA